MLINLILIGVNKVGCDLYVLFFCFVLLIILFIFKLEMDFFLF